MQTDTELVALATGGDTESFNQLILRWERPIFALAYRVIGREEDARDVCQETFLRAFRGIKAFKGQAKFSSWLYRIALNLCRDWMRRERRTAIMTPLDTDGEPSLPDLSVETAEARTVRRDLGRLMTEAMATHLGEAIAEQNRQGEGASTGNPYSSPTQSGALLLAEGLG